MAKKVDKPSKMGRPKELTDPVRLVATIEARQMKWLKNHPGGISAGTREAITAAMSSRGKGGALVSPQAGTEIARRRHREQTT